MFAWSALCPTNGLKPEPVGLGGLTPDHRTDETLVYALCELKALLYSWQADEGLNSGRNHGTIPMI